MTTYHFTKGHMMINSGEETVLEAYKKLCGAYTTMYGFEANGVDAEVSLEYIEAKDAYKEAYLEYDRVYGLYGA